MAMMMFSEAPLVESAPLTRGELDALLMKAGFTHTIDIVSADTVATLYAK